MFGGLKKRLQTAIKKIAGKVEPVEPKEEMKQRQEEEMKQEEQEEVKLEKMPVEERIEHEIEERREEMEKIEESIEKEELEKKMPEDHQVLIEEKEILEEVKAEVRSESKKEEVTQKDSAEQRKFGGKPRLGFLKKLTKKAVEKVLSESDIQNILQELQIALLENDVALEVAEKICMDVKNDLIGKAVKRGKVGDLIKDSLKKAILDVLQQPEIDLEKRIEEKEGPLLVMMVGFNGVGKTTNLAKIAHRFKKYNPVLAAGDTFRAASIEQLEEHGRRLGMKVIKHQYGADSAAVIFDARKHAESIGAKLVLADTAGRSHANANLMDELKKVVRVNKPDLKILVLDSLTGNDIYDQAKLFNDAIGVDAIILSKADVYEKGGAALSAAYTIQKPILFMGVGQEYKDLKEFVPEEIVSNLLG